MNPADDKMIAEAQNLTAQDADLMAALREWFTENRRPDADITDFDKWVKRQLEYMACRIHSPTAQTIAAALRVNAIGCTWGRYAVQNLKGIGLDADLCCYVEDDIVNASVWIKAKDAATAKCRADLLAKRMTERGWTAEVWVDDEDDTETTVTCTVPFGKYLEMPERNGR